MGRFKRNGLISAADPDPTAVPYNLDAERNVIGGLVVRNSFVSEVRKELDPGDFFRETHEILYRAILDLADSHNPVDSMLLLEHLESTGELSRAGGDDYLADILRGLPHAENTTYYAKIVRQKSIARRALVACQRSAEDIRSGRFHVAKSIERTCRRLDRLRGLCRPPEPERRATTVCLADVEAEPVHWLWPRRFPLGMLTLLIGDPSVGKSFITLGMASTISVGAPWPDSNGECSEVGSTILLTAEDSLSHTVRPRLDRAGADPAKVHALTTVKRDDGTLGPFCLASDLPRLEEALDRIADCRLLVIDPVSAYLGTADEHRNAEVRGLIAPLSEVAERRRISVILVTHMNKGTGTKALYRATGSLAFVAAARMAWLVTPDRDDPLRQLMLPVKHNIVERPDGLAYRIGDGVIQWETEPVTIRAEDALAMDKAAGDCESANRAERASGFLRTILQPGASMPSDVILAAGKAVGISRSALFEAKKALGIEARKTGNGWEWLGSTRPLQPPYGDLDDSDF